MICQDCSEPIFLFGLLEALGIGKGSDMTCPNCMKEHMTQRIILEMAKTLTVVFECPGCGETWEGNVVLKKKGTKIETVYD